LSEFVNLFFSVSEVSSVGISVSLFDESVSGTSKFEGPEEVISLLKVGTTGGDFVDKIFNADDSVFSEGVFNNLVGGKGNSLSVNLSESSLVD